MRTVAVERAEPGPELPVYHCTVLAEPFARLVAVDNGEPETRSGGCAAVTVEPLGKPRFAIRLAGDVEIESAAASLVLMVITPPWTVDGVEVPVIESIFDSNVCTLAVMLIWLGLVGAPLTKLSVVPLTVRVSPAEKPGDSESLPEAPD